MSPVDGPLSDVRVLDLTSVVMGPFATQILGDLGADVITVEDIGGDTNRYMGVGPHPQLSGVALNLMRNKRNVSLDLKHPDGREAFLRLAETADVMVTNLRPGPLRRLRLAYDDVRARKPDIVYCQAQGWPTDGPDADKPAYDDVVQSASGVADVYALQGGEPRIVPTIMADKVSGLTIVYTVLAALHHQRRTGEGQRVEVPMVEVMRSFMLAEHASSAVPVPALGPAGYTRVLSADRRPQRTADGWIHVLPYSRDNYQQVFRAVGRDDLADDPCLADRASRAAAVDHLYAAVGDALLQRTTAEWLAFCDEHDIPCSAIVALDDIVAGMPVATHPVAGDYRVIPNGIRLDATPPSVRRHAALIGQDADEVLSEVGYSSDEIASLRAVGAVRSRTS
ncbi:MAG TPA: CoA transferase [Acidimicrobiaceae bacterium]|nr:CoA transferase [Acidimicrobiaceae bacterium]